VRSAQERRVLRCGDRSSRRLGSFDAIELQLLF
jgi:hypothetical protein